MNSKHLRVRNTGIALLYLHYYELADICAVFNLGLDRVMLVLSSWSAERGRLPKQPLEDWRLAVAAGVVKPFGD